ncbi:MAG TPA: TetR/AcrR family transcriptional regulator [Marmoricola sp.]|nr:TetR/AcrR family transcriptional regulator [Marmoricola sp.]
MPTQQERRESAIARLLDASIETIIEVGYAKASASTITKRAGLSHGALFRHFETMSDFMAATAGEALRRQMGDFTARIEAAKAAGLQVADVLRIMRAVMGSRTNAVMYELTTAARTDKELQRILQAGSTDYLAAVRATARTLPGLGHIPDELFSTLVLLLTDVFDAEASMNAVRPLAADELGRRDDFLQLIYTFTQEKS